MATRVFSHRTGSRAAVVLLGLAGFAFAWSEIAGATARAAEPAPHPLAGAVTSGFDKTEPGRRVSLGIPVSRTAHARGARPWVVYTVPLPELDRGEHLQVHGEVGLTRCNKSDQRPGAGGYEGTLDSPCESIRHPYAVPNGGRYSPRIGVRAFIGSSPSDLSVGIGSWHAERCSARSHHCPLNVRTDVDAPADEPNAYLNLAVVAFSKKARLGRRGRALDVAELMGDCEGDDYDPAGPGYCAPVMGDAASISKGALSVTRFGEDRTPAQPQTSDTLLNDHIPVRAVPEASPSAPGSRVILRMPVSDLSPGDVVNATARFHVRDHPGDGFRFHHLIRGLLFISGKPYATAPRIAPGSPDRWLSGSMGTNCPHRSGCEAKKVGATAIPAGAPARMWVTYVGSAVEMGGVNGALTDVSDGRLSVAVDPAGQP